MGHGGSGVTDKVSLGPAITYQSIPCGKPTPGWPNSYLEVGCPQGEFDLLITEILYTKFTLWATNPWAPFRVTTCRA
jgi:hypothetical protein